LAIIGFGRSVALVFFNINYRKKEEIFAKEVLSAKRLWFKENHLHLAGNEL